MIHPDNTKKPLRTDGTGGQLAFCYMFRVCFDSTLGDEQQPNSKAVQNSCSSRPFFNLIPVPTFPFCLPNLTR